MHENRDSPGVFLTWSVFVRISRIPKSHTVSLVGDFLKLWVPLWGVPRLRAIVFCSLYWVPYVGKLSVFLSINQLTKSP